MLLFAVVGVGLGLGLVVGLRLRLGLESGRAWRLKGRFGRGDGDGGEEEGASLPKERLIDRDTKGRDEGGSVVEIVSLRLRVMELGH